MNKTAIFLSLVSLCTRLCAGSDVCHLPKVTGPCKAAFPRWAYENGKCVQFIYGGCQGNANNFESKEECEAQCPPAETNVCSLPLESGMCLAYMPSWGSENGVCKQFIYGGCGGNANRFGSKAECQAACPDRCSQPIESGMCYAYFPSWGYENGRCRRFIYGGCGGNDNRFSSWAECQKACKARPDQCHDAEPTNSHCPGHRQQSRWFYSGQAQKCVRMLKCVQGGQPLGGYRTSWACRRSCEN